MADILDAAKQQAKSANPQGTSVPPPLSGEQNTSDNQPVVAAMTPPAPTPSPLESVPGVPLPAAPVEPPLPRPESPATARPVSRAEEPEADANKVTGSILATAGETPAGPAPDAEAKGALPSEPAPTMPPPAPKKRGVGKGTIVSVLLILFITLPLIIYYTSQQRQIAEIRSRATGPYGNYCSRSSPNTADCTDKSAGSACTRRPEYGGGSGTCQQIFSDPFGANMECECAVSGETPPPTLPPGTGTPPPAGTGTPPPGTPTQPPGPQCQNIKIYKAGQALSAADLANLKPGDDFNIVIIGAGATKARARVNGGDWTETTDVHTLTGGFRVPFTIPQGVTNFSIEGELFIGGAWH